MRLLLTLLTFAALSLFVLSRGVPITLHGEIITLQVNIAHPAEEPSPNPSVSSTVPSPAQAEPAPPAEAHNSTKYFHEPGNTDLLGHYDARFYKGAIVSYEERSDTLHHMIRAYLTILHDLHIETWIAHGTLLGWWWNQEILPWDWDLDVQVSGQTLAYLGEFFNHTTHKYLSEGIEREYFLDVNPHYQERIRGDGENIIDARWIDVRNGLFIDITGISETNPVERSGIWSCKNEHDYNVTDIWPLRESNFEGVKAMVPNAYDKVLRDEYEDKALSIVEYEGHRWDPKLEKWVLDPTVKISKHDDGDSEPASSAPSSDSTLEP